ncbi:MAG: thioredoxin family protein [bacterium]|nr:thioredoxin family protein [bacterium]
MAEKKKKEILGITHMGWIQIIVICIAVLFAFFLTLGAGYGDGSGISYGDQTSATAEFATCVTESGAVLYGTDWCSHCKDQKALFGEHFEKVKFVDCDDSSDLCSLAEIEAYPTWIIDGEKHLGTKSLENLGTLTGCEVEE